ncbi:hypothetical protein [Actinocorallia aurea]
MCALPAAGVRARLGEFAALCAEADRCPIPFALPTGPHRNSEARRT